MEENEDDIWNYHSKCKKPRKESRRKSKASVDPAKETELESNQSQRPSRNKPSALLTILSTSISTAEKQRSKSSTQKNRKSPKNGKKLDTIASPNQTKIDSSQVMPAKNSQSQAQYGGFCPLCQMPFSVLVVKVETPSWHVSECVDLKPSTKECPDGLTCDSTIPLHYQDYNHHRLAQFRSKEIPIPVITVTEEDNSNSQCYSLLSPETHSREKANNTVISPDTLSRKVTKISPRYTRRSKDTDIKHSPSVCSRQSNDTDMKLSPDTARKQASDVELASSINTGQLQNKEIKLSPSIKTEVSQSSDIKLSPSISTKLSQGPDTKLSPGDSTRKSQSAGIEQTPGVCAVQSQGSTICTKASPSINLSISRQSRLSFGKRTRSNYKGMDVDDSDSMKVGDKVCNITVNADMVQIGIEAPRRWQGVTDDGSCDSSDSEVMCSPVNVSDIIDMAAVVKCSEEGSDSDIDDIMSASDSEEDAASLSFLLTCEDSNSCSVSDVGKEIVSVSDSHGTRNCNDNSIDGLGCTSQHKRPNVAVDSKTTPVTDQTSDINKTSAYESQVSSGSQSNDKWTGSQSEQWAAVFTHKKVNISSQIPSSQSSQSSRKSRSNKKKNSSEKILKSPNTTLSSKAQTSLTSFFKVQSYKQSDNCEKSSNKLDDIINLTDESDDDRNVGKSKIDSNLQEKLQSQSSHSSCGVESLLGKEMCKSNSFKITDKAKQTIKSLIHSTKEQTLSTCSEVKQENDGSLGSIENVNESRETPCKRIPESPNEVGERSFASNQESFKEVKDDSLPYTKTKLKRSATDILMANRGNIQSSVDQKLKRNMTFENKKSAWNLRGMKQSENMGSVTEDSSKTVDSGSSSVGDSYNGQKSAKRKRYCPFYKKIPGTGFTVDAFSFGEIAGCTGYFLSHYHYDHYRGLTKHFSGKLYCSQITANLVMTLIKVKKETVHPITMNSPIMIEDVQVTFLEANHCPGSVLILFKLKSGATYLHTGDFRADRNMESYPALVGLRVQQLYLDTTYCDPSYAFPPQDEVIQFAVNLVLKELKNNSNIIIVCGSYTIGKERIFIAISEALGCKICVTRDKMRVLSCLEDENLKKKLSLNYNDSQLHVLPMGKLNIKSLSEHLSSQKKKYTGLVALEPTGWSYSAAKGLQGIKPKANRNGIKVIGVPYSEHSSFLELKRFVQFLRPDKILPTVNNGNPDKRRQMESTFKCWMEEDSSCTSRRYPP